MSDDNILKLFEGLTPSQARELSGRIIPALRSIRDEITAKGKEKMFNLTDLTPEEMGEYARAIEDAEGRIKAKRQLTAEQREAEAIRRQIADLTAKIELMQKQPSRYKSELPAAMRELDIQSARLEAVAPKPEPAVFNDALGQIGAVSSGPGGPRRVG